MGKRLRGGATLLNTSTAMTNAHPRGALAASTQSWVREPFKPSRRSVLMGMTTLSASVAMAGLPSQALAAPPSQSGRLLWSISRELFIELAAWYIKEALPLLPFNIKDTDIKTSETATPGGTNFHNDCACVYQIRKPIKVARTKYDFCCAIDEDGFLRAHTDENIPIVKDMNTTELVKIQHIHDENKKLLLFPCGPREAPSAEEKLKFSEFCKAEKIDRQEWDLVYCRNINDGQNLHRGYALKRTKGISSSLKGATQFLLDDNP